MDRIVQPSFAVGRRRCATRPGHHVAHDLVRALQRHAIIHRVWRQSREQPGPEHPQRHPRFRHKAEVKSRDGAALERIGDEVAFHLAARHAGFAAGLLPRRFLRFAGPALDFGRRRRERRAGGQTRANAGSSEPEYQSCCRHPLPFLRRRLPAPPATRRDATDLVSVIADSLTNYLQSSDVWTGKSPLQDTSGELQEASVFAEDTWRIAPRLTLTYGLRWKSSPGPVPNVAANFLNPVDLTWTTIRQPLWKTNYSNLAPRAGFALRPFHGDRTVIRGGFGLYYDSSLSLATDLINDGPLNVSEYRGVNVFVSTQILFGFLPNLRLPLIKQWNASIEHAFDDKDSISLGYVGSSSQDLIRREVAGEGSTSTTWYATATNDGSSTYNALEAHYRRRISHGLQAVVSYAWSHSIDNSSTDSGLYWAGSGRFRARIGPHRISTSATLLQRGSPTNRQRAAAGFEVGRSTGCSGHARVSQ